MRGRDSQCDGVKTNRTLLESLPARFRDDHAERGLPDTVESIKADAEYYANTDGPDECPKGIKQSARATLTRIRTWEKL